MTIKQFICLLAFSFFLKDLSAQEAPGSAKKDSLKVIKIDTSDDGAKDPVRVFTKVEYESRFPGGQKAWMEFLNTHLSYPKKAVRKRIEGTVVVQFIVAKDGSISSLEAISGDPILEEAAVKAMKEMPNWIPATQNGARVKSFKKQPVVFRLEGK
jgi:protein TonB